MWFYTAVDKPVDSAAVEGPGKVRNAIDLS